MNTFFQSVTFLSALNDVLINRRSYYNQFVNPFYFSYSVCLSYLRNIYLAHLISSRNCIILPFVSRPIIQLKLFLCMVWGKCTSLVFSVSVTKWPSTIDWKAILFLLLWCSAFVINQVSVYLQGCFWILYSAQILYYTMRYYTILYSVFSFFLESTY